MTIFGLDISHHQGDNPDLAKARAEGIEFVFIKATEGNGFRDPKWYANVAKAQAAGLLVAAYHFVTAGSSAAAQVAHIMAVVPKDMPVIPDVESGVAIPFVRDLVARLRAAGYRVPLLYLPQWYWRQIGAPDLTGLPPLWASRYPDNVIGNLRDEFARVPASHWTGYGGLPVAVLQFTSSARVAGYAPLDANAYGGTVEQFRTMLLGTKETTMRNLILANKTAANGTPTGEIWVGDGITRRHVADEKELQGLVYWIGKSGGDATIQLFSDLRVLGDVPAEVVPVEIDYTRFVSDVVAGLAARVTLEFEPVTPTTDAP